METAVTHGTFVIEKSYPAAPERVFAAFADPAKKRRWMGEGDAETAEFEMDFRVGGNERRRALIKNGPYAGTPLTNHSHYQDIVANRRIVFAYTMTLGEKRISASLVTVELSPNGKGTNLVFTDQGAYFEGADGPKMREGGWRKLLEGVEKVLGANA
jgi:uncharacterized protein YndB with AHSA1/START domain